MRPMRRMFVRQRRFPRGRVLLVGAGAVVAGVMYLGGDGAHPAEIAGAPLATAIPAAPLVAPEPTVPTVLPAAAPASLDLAALDLSGIRRDGERYTLALGDGRTAELTLDPSLQELAERLLVDSRAPRGAIVAMAPDGAILALAGRRADAPTGSRAGTPDPKLAIETWAPAASIFKLVTASALVEAGVDPTGKVCFHGGLRSVLEHNLRDDPRDSRCENLTYGVARSNNAILGKLAFQKLEPRALTDAAKLFGWRTDNDAPSLLGELVSPPARDLAFAKMAAGFSTDAKLSVVGGALLAATFARDGDQPAPRLIAAIDGTVLPAAPARHVLAPATAHAVARMMVETCETGSAAKSFGRGGAVRAAGKTGTLARTEPFFMEHSWFVGYAPADRPKIVISVVLGNPESWHLRGHEAARKLIDRFLRASGSEKDRSARRPKS
jgi:penicillin-binding protein A